MTDKEKSRNRELNIIQDQEREIKQKDIEIQDLLRIKNDLNDLYEKMKCCGNCDNVGASGVTGCFCYLNKEYIAPHCWCENWRLCTSKQKL